MGESQEEDEADAATDVDATTGANATAGADAEAFADAAADVGVVVVVVAPEGRRSRPQNLMSTNVQAELAINI